VHEGAHAETLDRAKLEAAFQPVVTRLGDQWDVVVTAPKITMFDPYYEAAGIGGQYSPISFETFLNSSFLPFEVPRALAHEWAHVAGFTDEELKELRHLCLKLVLNMDARKELERV